VSFLNKVSECFSSESSRLLPQNVKIKKYRLIILHVILYGCETWPLMLRDQVGLRTFENEIIQFRIKLLSEELRGLCPLPSIIRMMQILEGEISEVCITHGREVHIKFW
jgi:hypothetical protein